MPDPTGDPGEFDDALAIANAGRAGAANPVPRTTGTGYGHERGAELGTTDAAQEGAAPRGPVPRGAETRGADARGADPRAGERADERADERAPERPWFDPWHAPWGNGRHAPRQETGAADRTPDAHPRAARDAGQAPASGRNAAADPLAPVFHDFPAAPGPRPTDSGPRRATSATRPATPEPEPLLPESWTAPTTSVRPPTASAQSPSDPSDPRTGPASTESSPARAAGPEASRPESRRPGTPGPQGPAPGPQAPGPQTPGCETPGPESPRLGSGTPRTGEHRPEKHRHREHHSPWDVARAVASEAVDGPLEPGAVPLGPEALGRVLAGALTALTDLPSFDTSAMDGWAVSGPGPWRLAAPRTVAPAASAGILAGQGRARPLPDGHAVPIATGARIPPGASAVLRSEHGETAEQPDGSLMLTAPRGAPPGQDIRPRGQECRNGDPLLPPGTPVTPAVLGLAAAAGYDELWTYRRPVVEILVLGDELLHSGLPQEGRIRDALGPMLAPWLHAMGAETIGPRHLADDEATLYEAVAGSTADVVITTGGTAAGPVDHVHPTLHRLGAELLVDGVQVRPGHPMLLARLGPVEAPARRGRSARRAARQAPASVSRETPAVARHLVGLPGNPLAAVSGLLTLAAPLLGTLAGRTRSELRRVCLADGVQGHPHDTRLVPVACRTDEKGGTVALPLHFNGPAMLRGIAAAGALAVIPPGGAAAGEPIALLDLPWSAAAAFPDTATAPTTTTASTTATASRTAPTTAAPSTAASDTATTPGTGAHGGPA
ncbi:molybdopterin molybdotransferase MoeA [Streptomyces olivaceiscleroticus]|uniref:Molybdopterin molybdenumtransferase n=1 Tax=Streptomyces olivaceiscleroticus TaxID=68245 RepID=A0ABN1A6Q1_9ACTN